MLHELRVGYQTVVDSKVVLKSDGFTVESPAFEKLDLLFPQIGKRHTIGHREEQRRLHRSIRKKRI